MGQYFKPVNKDKKEFVCPWCIGAGAKLWEWAANRQGCIFTLLLRQSSSTGGGDYGGQALQSIELREHTDIGELLAKGLAREGMRMPIPKESIVGRWAGDRVVLIGDYDDSELYATATALYRNISEPLVEAWNQFLGDDQFKLNFSRCSGCTERFYAEDQR